MKIGQYDRTLSPRSQQLLQRGMLRRLRRTRRGERVKRRWPRTNCLSQEAPTWNKWTRPLSWLTLSPRCVRRTSAMSAVSWSSGQHYRPVPTHSRRQRRNGCSVVSHERLRRPWLGACNYIHMYSRDTAVYQYPAGRYDCGVGRHGRIHGRMSPSYYGLFYISGLYDRVLYLECPASRRRRSAYEICT